MKTTVLLCLLCGLARGDANEDYNAYYMSVPEWLFDVKDFTRDPATIVEGLKAYAESVIGFRPELGDTILDVLFNFFTFDMGSYLKVREITQVAFHVKFKEIITAFIRQSSFTNYEQVRDELTDLLTRHMKTARQIDTQVTRDLMEYIARTKRKVAMEKKLKAAEEPLGNLLHDLGKFIVDTNKRLIEIERASGQCLQWVRHLLKLMALEPIVLPMTPQDFFQFMPRIQEVYTLFHSLTRYYTTNREESDQDLELLSYYLNHMYKTEGDKAIKGMTRFISFLNPSSAFEINNLIRDLNPGPAVKLLKKQGDLDIRIVV